MFCGNCGSQMDDGSQFCGVCGWQVKAQGAQGSAPNNAQQGMAAPGGANAHVNVKLKKPRVKIPKPVFAVVGAAAAVAVVAGGATALGAPNAVRRTFSSPEKYYKWVEQNSSQEIASSIAGVYDKYILDGVKVYDTGASGSISLELDTAGKSMLNLLSRASGYDFSWLENIGVSYELYSKDYAVEGKAALSIGNEQVISADAIVDLEDEMIYAALPELSSYYIGVDGSEIDSDVDEVFEACIELLDMTKTINKALPSEKKLDTLLTKYVDIALDCVEDVNKSTTTLKANGITQKCTALEVVIDQYVAADMLEAICDEAEDDEDLEDVIVAFCDEISNLDIDGFDEIDGDEAYEAFQEICEELQEEADDIAEDDDFEIIMTVYVNNKGNIIGRKFELDDGRYSSAELEYYFVKSGSNIGVEFSAEDYYDEVIVDGGGKLSGGKLSGDFSLEVDRIDVADIKVTKFDLASLKDGSLNGGFSVSAASGLKDMVDSDVYSYIRDMELSLDLAIDRDSISITAALADDGDKWGSITLENSKKDAKVSIPSSKNIIDVYGEDGLLDYVDTIDWEDFFDTLDDAGLSSIIIDFIGEETGYYMRDLDDLLDLLDLF